MEKLFGVSIEGIMDAVLEQMLSEAKGKDNFRFVVNEQSRQISLVLTDEHYYVNALGIPTHNGTEINRLAKSEIDRRAKARRVISELLRKIGVDPTAEAVQDAWVKAEAARKNAVPVDETAAKPVREPREVPPRTRLQVVNA
jgi:hypothetical protein